MRHDVFGEIAYSEEDEAWTGTCSLPVFAEYGKPGPDLAALDDPPPEFARGQFAFTVHDSEHAGPTEQQANAFRHLLEHEADVCRAVMTALVDACGQKGGILRWLNERRGSRLWGWLARLVGPEYKTPEDLKPAVRCSCFEVGRGLLTPTPISPFTSTPSSASKRNTVCRWFTIRSKGVLGRREPSIPEVGAQNPQNLASAAQRIRGVKPGGARLESAPRNPSAVLRRREALATTASPLYHSTLFLPR
ncbi:MAG: hypothetical protein U0793_16125 [Gemmataceae bacterium]